MDVHARRKPAVDVDERHLGRDGASEALGSSDVPALRKRRSARPGDDGRRLGVVLLARIAEVAETDARGTVGHRDCAETILLRTPRLAGLAVDASLLYAAHARAAVDRISLAVEYPAVNHGGEFFVRKLRDEILDRRLPGEHIVHLDERGRLRQLSARGRGGFAAEAVRHLLHDDGIVEIHFRHMDATVARPAVADKYRAAMYLPLRLVFIVARDVHPFKRQGDGQGRAGRDHWRLCEGAEPRFIERTPVKPAHDDIRPRHLARVLDRHGNLDVFQATFDLCGRQLECRVGKAVSERIAHHLHAVNFGAGVSLQVEASAFCIEVSVADIRSLGILDFRGLPAVGRRVVAVALRPRVDGPAGRIHLSRQNARYRIARRLAEERDEHKRLDRVLVHERRI